MTHTPTRRDFLKSSLLLGLGASSFGAYAGLPSSSFFSVDKLTGPRGLAPFIAGDDLLRLVALSELPKSVRQALTVNREVFHLGWAWTVDNAGLQTVLRESGQLWRAEQGQDRGFTQFALAAGHLAARAMNEALGTEEDDAEASRYRDTYLFKQLQNARPHARRVAVDGPVPEVTPAEVAELLHLMQQRNLIRMHTLRPEFSDVETWLTDFLGYYAEMKAENLRYGEVFCNPEVEKLRRYVLEPDFYDPEDAPILAARQLANGEVVGRVTPDLATASSQYGRALLRGMDVLGMVSSQVTGA